MIVTVTVMRGAEASIREFLVLQQNVVEAVSVYWSIKTTSGACDKMLRCDCEIEGKVQRQQSSTEPHKLPELGLKIDDGRAGS